MYSLMQWRYKFVGIMNNYITLIMNKNYSIIFKHENYERENYAFLEAIFQIFTHTC